MVRALCLISREYPPETAFGGIARISEMTAHALRNRGIAVHVVSLSPSGAYGRQLVDGVTVHRIGAGASPVAGAPEVEQGIWSSAVAEFYRQLDTHVHFDAVIAPEYFAESMKLETAPGVPLVVQLHTSRAVLDRPDPRRRPAEATAAEMELFGVRRADTVIAPTRLIAARTEALTGVRAVVIAPAFDTTAISRVERRPDRALELVFLGRLEPNKRPELALAALAELRRRGLNAHLTLVGRDTPLGPSGSSYRTSVLTDVMREQGLSFDAVRFVEQLDFAGVVRHLAAAHVAVLPSRFENLHTTALEALAMGVPVISGSETGLSCWMSADDGLFTITSDDAGQFAREAADQISDVNWRAQVGARAPRRIEEIFQPARAAEGYCQLIESLSSTVRVPDAIREPAARSPRLGVVMLAHNALAYTKRAVMSLLAHTEVPMRLVVVDNASSDGTSEWLSSIEDPRVVVVDSPTNAGVSGGRNLGIDALSGDEELICFLDNDVEVLARWWEPFVEALRTDPEAGIAGEDGVLVRWSASGREITSVLHGQRGRCDVVVGFCMVLEPSALRRIGRFDERLGLFWHDDDDLALRASRIGIKLVAVGSGRVLHFEHRSSATVAGIWDSAERSAPGELSAHNQRLVAQKRLRQLPAALAPFLVIADATEAATTPDVLASWNKAMTAEDEAALVLLGPGLDPAALTDALEEMARKAHVSLDTGAKVILLAPATVDSTALDTLADEAYAHLGAAAPTGSFAHLAWLRVDNPSEIRALAARAWRARPSSVARKDIEPDCTALSSAPANEVKLPATVA